MADEIIGSVGIQIEADASDLQGQFDAAVAQAESASERIAQAFESLIGIGEALAITEGLKEFGEEALNVYGTVQSVTIGLTQLTKSASQANEIIGQIKELANTEPFAFPEIAPTVQKMVALGVSAEAIPRVMQAAADTAAATGNSFDAVANAIDRMALSGNAGARQLTQLGISTKDLGEIMGVSADQVKKAFTEMDQSDRLDVLTQALDKFAGAAEAQAQGIAGQWQIFQNKFEEVMEGVGEAITPAVADLLKFGEEGIQIAQELVDWFNKLPGPVKEVAGAVAIAAASIAPLAAGVGLLGQGLIGIQAVVGSVSTLMGTFSASTAEAATATAAEGVAATAAAPAVTALAVAETAAGEAASVSAVQLGLFGEAIGSETVYTSAAITQLGLFDEATAATAVTAGESAAAVGGLGFSLGAMEAVALTAGTAIAGIVGYKLGEWATNNVPGFKDLTQSILETAYAMSPTFADAFHALTGGFISFGGELEGQAEEIKNLQSQLATLGITVSSVGLTTDQYVDALRKARAAHQDLDASASGTEKALASLNEKAQGLQSTFDKAQAVLALATAGLKDGTTSLTAYELAVEGVDKAQKALNAGNKDYTDTLSGMTEAYNKQQGVISTLEQTQSQLLSLETRTADQENILTEVSNKLAAAKKAEAEAHNLVKIAIQGQGAAYEGLVTSADAFLKKETDASQAVNYAKSVLDDLNSRLDTSPEHYRAVNDAVQQYAQKLVAAGGSMTDLIQVTINGVPVWTTIGDVINKAKAGLDAFKTSSVNVAQEFPPLANGFKNIADGANASITMIKGSDDALKQYHGTIVDGQVKINGYVDDTTRAIGYQKEFTGSVTDTGAAIGNTLTPNLNSAGSSLSNLSLEAEQAQKAMQALGTAAKTTGDEIDQAIGAMDNWDSHMGSADATGLGAWALAAQMTGETTFAGSGAAVNSQGQQVSALTELQAANQAAGNALAASLGLTTTATVTNTAAVVSNTTSTASNTAATVASTSAISSAVAPTSSLADSASSLGTALGATTGAAAQFVDGLGNVYSSYQALVAAIAANPLLGGPAQSVTGAVGSGPSVSSTSVVGPDGVTYPSAFALFQAEQANPNILSHQSTGQDLSFIGPQGGNSVSGNVSQSQFLNSLASLFPGSFSMQSAIAQNPGVPFGANASPGGTPVQVVMNYPQFNSQQQSQKTMNDVVTMLRTVPSLKL